MHPDSLGDAPAPRKPKMTPEARINAVRVREANKLINRVRKLRSEAILLEAQADKLLGDAGEAV